MVAAGTVRTATENRLIALIAALPRFCARTTQQPDKFSTSAPLNLDEPQNRRWCVVGTADGPIDPDAIAAGMDPSVDEWSIACALFLDNIADAQEAKAEVEAALNEIADMLAADDRLGMPDGPRDVRIAAMVGPKSAVPKGKPRQTWINFDITASADIERNQ